MICPSIIVIVIYANKLYTLNVMAKIMIHDPEFSAIVSMVQGATKRF